MSFCQPRQLWIASTHDWLANDSLPGMRSRDYDIADVSGLAVDILCHRSTSQNCSTMDWMSRTKLFDAEATALVSLAQLSETVSLTKSASLSMEREPKFERNDSSCNDWLPNVHDAAQVTHEPPSTIQQPIRAGKPPIVTHLQMIML